jgi:4'-phosphopantetheinyl transferase
MSTEVYWLAAGEAAVPPGDGWLSDREIAVCAALRIPKRRNDWRLGRWTAKSAIAAYRGFASNPAVLAAIEVRPAPSGAPLAFFDGRPAGVAISLSHSHGVGFCAVAREGANLGCDVEKVTPHSQAFVTDYFTPAEQELVERSEGVEQRKVLTLLWSAKESLLKALECGLRCDTRSVAAIPAGLPPCRRAAWRRLAVRENGVREFHGWWRETGGFVWTVIATPEPAEPIALFRTAVAGNYEAAASDHSASCDMSIPTQFLPSAP